MADRKVTHTGKDEDGNITKLCNSGQDWKSRSKAGAISDIENGTHTYFVKNGINRYFVKTGINRSDIHVVKGSSGKYLRSDPDSSSSNNLDNMPDC